MPEFTGPATRFSQGAIDRAADDIGCDVAAVKAVIDVESRGGFLADTRPKILFERHIFSKRTGAKFDQSHPDISSSKPGGYMGGAAEYDRLARDRARSQRGAPVRELGRLSDHGVPPRVARHSGYRGFLPGHVQLGG